MTHDCDLDEGDQILRLDAKYMIFANLGPQQLTSRQKNDA